jgi:rhodanese-related sulfurtransferase
VPIRIGRSELERLLERDDVQLVEVLPREEFEDEHLPGAINVPLRHIEREAGGRLDRNRPVVVYCFDAA